MPVQQPFLSSSALDIGISEAHHKRTAGLNTTGHDIGGRWGAVPSRGPSQTLLSSSLGPRRSPTMRRSLVGPPAAMASGSSPLRTTAGDWAKTWATETKELKRMLRSQSSLLGHEPTRWASTSSSHRAFAPQEVQEARGKINAEVKADLQAVHYKLGEDSPKKLPFKLWESTHQRQESWCHAHVRSP